MDLARGIDLRGEIYTLKNDQSGATGLHRRITLLNSGATSKRKDSGALSPSYTTLLAYLQSPKHGYTVFAPSIGIA